MPRPADTYSLVADIGGTNTRVALALGPELLPETIRRYRNADYPGLESVLRAFIAEEEGVDCKGACVAVAGPVHDGKATLTNLDWTIDRAGVARATRAETVAVLNDLQAQGHALGRIAPQNLRSVIAGPVEPIGSTKLVIGVGTGFNSSPVYETPLGRIVPPSESGHVSLPIRTESDLRLMRDVETIHGFPSVEDVLSGRGLERVYAWLSEEAGRPTEKSAADIVAGCETGSDPLAREAVRVFVRILGSVAGNLALIFLPFGGVYLIGGVMRHVAPFLDEFDFAGAFRDKGRFAGFMGNFGVAVVEDDYAALGGAAAHLTDLFAAPGRTTRT
ncbi:MAG: glucokinase [Rhodobacteraceae bacterium]|jgi:glucokinase|nr:glucokinase [Paracoccaceae bacterium]